MDTMGSQCYGSKNYELLGVYTTRTRLILCTIFILYTLPTCVFSYEILLYLNIDETLAEGSCFYIFYMLPTVFITFNFNLNVRFLQVMQCYLTPLLIAISAIVIHYIICYVAVIILELELGGVCICSAITMSYCLIMSTAYIVVANQCPDSLVFYHLERFINGRRFLVI